MDDGKKQPGHSKYDFVKVKVWLGEHYYILSRFLISRMLTVTKIPYMKAVKIALEVKKHFVDREELDISQTSLEEALFRIMFSRGFCEDYISRYKMVTKFFQQKRPLIILLCGASCIGKSTFAQQLASRLNLPNVLQTDIIYELMQLAGHCQAPQSSAAPLDPQQIIAAFQTECRDVRRGIDGDLTKSIRDGKPIIIEGLHLDPGLYLYEFGKYGVAHLLRESSLAADHRAHLEQLSDSRLLAQAEDGLQKRSAGSKPLRRSLSAHEVAFFLQRNSAPSGLSQTNLQQKLAGALSSKSFDSGQAQTQQFLDDLSLPVSTLAEDAAANGTADLITGRSPASEWLQQYLPNFSKQLPPATPAATQSPTIPAAGMPHAPSQATDSSRPTWPHLADESDILNESGSLPPPPAQMQQQQTQQRLGRGQLFHCWRRKPGQPYTMAAPDGASPPAHDTGASALPSASYTIGELSCQEAETLYEESNAAAWGSDESQKSSDKSRRASFHMGQDEQPISETIPLHGPGRPHSSRPHPDPHSNVYSDAEDRPISTGRDASGSTAFSRETLKPSGSEASSNSHLPHQDDHAPSLHTSARSGAEGSALSEPALPETCHSLGQSSESMRLQGAAAPHGQPQRVGQPGRADSPTGPHVPLFVPIVLILEQRDHEVLLREAASRNLGSSVEADEWVEQALKRSAALQDHLQTYASRSIPIVQLTLADFSSRLDTLHDYLLQCMEAAMLRQ